MSRSWAERYPPQPLRDYALLADGERGALVGPRGDVAWMCAPGWADEPVFAGLVGEGVQAITPLGERYVWGGHYEEGSLVWRSRWVTTSAQLECREALARPADRDTAVLLRRIVGVEGESRARMVLDPRVGGGTRGLEDLRHEDGVWTGRLGDLWLRCTGLGEGTRDDTALVAEVTVREGGRHDLVLEIGRCPFAEAPPRAAELWRMTEEAWRQDVPEAAGLWARRDVRQSYAVLAGMTSASGGMVAAATRSLPERAEQGRDYDYRYAWLRDQAMVGQAVAAVGPHRLLQSAVDFVGDRVRADEGSIRPAYTVAGAPVPAEQDRSLPGYPGGSDRAGNDAGEQFQLDVFGEVLHLFAAAAAHGALDASAWRAVETAVAAIGEHWRRPDAGVWELDDRRWTHSRQMLAGGLERVARLAPGQQAEDWRRLADRIGESVRRECLHPSGRWQRAPDDERVDSALLIPIVRQPDDPAADPAARRTVEAVLADLTDEEFCYRYRRHDRHPLEDDEGAFVLSGFDMAMALQRLGDHTLAARWFERNRSSCGTPGLFSEEYDVVQRQQRGNLPQAFVHGALIEASALLSH